MNPWRCSSSRIAINDRAFVVRAMDSVPRRASRSFERYRTFLACEIESFMTTRVSKSVATMKAAIPPVVTVFGGRDNLPLPLALIREGSTQFKDAAYAIFTCFINHLAPQTSHNPHGLPSAPASSQILHLLL
jgi:hypothetical protein